MKDFDNEIMPMATDAIDSFFKQFGKFDIYTQIVLEEFFKELFDEQELSLHISSKTRQEGNKDN
jgi:hypothetical protein